jgi:uncharacterized 2Fe-2S/4Fe-4S cluster protein (DUF4445 family)
VKAIVFPLTVTLDAPTPSDKLADRERLTQAVLAATGVDLPVEIDLEILRELPAFLRACNFSATLTVGVARDRIALVRLGRHRTFGAAIDLGTTNLVGSLFDMGSLERLCSAEVENPQVQAGLDVLTRVQLAMSGRSGELHRLIAEGVKALLEALCAEAGIDGDEICAAAIAGNTIMTHFLLGLPTDNIPFDPYIPVVNRADFVNAKNLGLPVNPRALVYVFPNVGSYVGGDIVAGILSSGLYLSEKPSVLIDVGTNAEIVLGCREWGIVGAGAAGPALEGGIAEIGMRALDGAIHSVRIDPGDFSVEIKTFGDGPPRGLCGSGMIELVSELYTAGILDSRGKLQKVTGLVRDVDGEQGFVLHESGEGALVIRNREIENFLRSKAAMFASLRVIVTSVGLRFADIEKVYVSGAFGKGIDAEKAARIGMIPAIERGKIESIGNSSLRGAEMLLLGRHLLPHIDRICGMITYKEMNAEGEFMREFPGALFIPHTNPELLES